MTKTSDKIRVLVVEDNVDVKNIIGVYLRSKGFEVLEAVDGQEGFEMAVRLSPDVILLDVLLPKLDGIETLQALRSSPQGAQVPVVMMSAVLQTRDIVKETQAYNVLSFLQKPFQVRQLIEHIQEALNGKSVAEKKVQPVKPRRPVIHDDDARAVTFMVGPPTQDVAAIKKIVCKTEPLPSTGNLSQYPLPKILHSVFFEKATGRLRIVADATEKRVYFQNGFPIYAESSLPEETLGVYLVQTEKISKEQHEYLQKKMESSGQRYGELLLSEQFLNPHELFIALESHLSEKIISTFSWFEGNFKFESGDQWKEQIIVARMKPGRIILDGILHAWSAERIKAIRIMRDTNIPFVLDDVLYSDSDLALTTLEARIWQLVKQNISISQILLKSGHPALALKTLFFFYIVGMVGFRVSPEGVPVHIDVHEDVVPKRKFSSRREDDSDRVQQLMSDYMKYRNANYFELLGVKKDSPIELINKAYMEKRAKYHPDQLAGLTPGVVHEKIEELNMLVHQAYSTLINQRSRRKYILSLDGDGDSDSTMLSPPRTKRNPILQVNKKNEGTVSASQHFEKGFSALRDGKYEIAESSFSAAEKMESKPKYMAYRIWTEYLSGKRKFEGTERELRMLSKKKPENATIFYVLGSLYLRNKKNKEAINCFEKVLSIDAQHIDAARQLRLIRMRSNSEVSGLFDLLKLKK
ncbi:MAG: response regulator [Deltaproteobacteria bacterium]|nr:response regulator [Deltaproteobacteria bacterium]MBN2672281.1 response regulator [Deltaproteobacteria bacterium]